MSIFNIPLAQIDRARLEALIANAVREGRQLDYKQALPGGSDEDKREFLGDVTSFANALGGDIIFGVQERREQGQSTGEPEAIVGLAGLNVDAERLRLENLIRDGVAPRIPPLNFQQVRCDPEPPCLVLRVRRSFVGLHMVTFKNQSRFYSRNSGGKYQLDVTEIRNAFVGLETAYERIRRLRADRVARVLAGETPNPIGDGPKFIVHAIPVAASDPWSRFKGLPEHDVINSLRPLDGAIGDWRYNLDGFVAHTGQDAHIKAYTQLFRDGGIEGASGSLVRLDRGTHAEIFGSQIERSLLTAFQGFQRLWLMLEVSGPFVVGLAVSGVRGCQMPPSAGYIAFARPAIDRDVLFIPRHRYRRHVGRASGASAPPLRSALERGWLASIAFLYVGRHLERSLMSAAALDRSGGMLPWPVLGLNDQQASGRTAMTPRTERAQAPGFPRFCSDGVRWSPSPGRTENPGVGGSIPSLPTILSFHGDAMTHGSIGRRLPMPR